ncbi:MAG: flagellar basal-body MS-ring/collar protein FliF [Janthinobacterium lividum]
MNAMDQVQRLWANLLQLGGRKLGALAAIGVAVFALVGVGGYYLSRPATETLYSGLDRGDVASIGAALHDADIPFDVSPDGSAVAVRYGQTAQARMLLAERGLPHSGNAGYELYDKMGSLGLTSFMQDVTRVRALEGELARTIQSMAGIRAARVHVVMPDEGSFRRARQPPSASVVIRASTIDDAHVAGAIRHLVASAVPGMTIDEVTVLSTDGNVLASGDDASNGAPTKMLDLEKVIDRNVAENIRRTLTPSLGSKNLQVSVTARLNTDTKQTAETVYNPDGRVERSTRTVKEVQNQQNSTNSAPATVGQNLPGPKPSSGDGKTSSEQNDKREELNNFEISSKTVTTSSAGYNIDRLSIAVVINRAAFAAALGDKAPAAEVDKKLAEVEQLVGTAAGVDKARGDSVKVMAVDFVDNTRDLEPIPSPGLMEAVMRQSGTLINAGLVLIFTGIVVVFVVRPLVRALSGPAASEAANDGLPALSMNSEPLMLPEPGELGSLDGLPMNLEGLGEGSSSLQVGGWGDEVSLIDDITSQPRRSPHKRLEQMIEFDEEQAAAVLKQWIHRKEAA